MERKSQDTGDIFPGLAFMERCNQEKSLDSIVLQQERVHLTEKLCPFDKKPCIGERCAVYREESGVCAFLLAGGRGTGYSSPQKRNADDLSKGKFKAHLFE
jgi:hypothetical protein